MQIQPITNQPNFNGKIVGKGVMILKDSHWDIPEGMDKSLCLEIPDNLVNKIRQMVKEKPYDVFISPNKANSELLNIDAGDSFEKIQKGIQGRTKVNRNALEALPQAIQDAIDIFEESLETLKSKNKILKKESL